MKNGILVLGGVMLVMLSMGFAVADNHTTNSTNATNTTEVNVTVTPETNTTNTTNVTTNTDPSVDLYVKEWYPKDNDYVFVCSNNFAANQFDWFYGDGHKLIDIMNGDTYHRYTATGVYTVSCTATNGATERSDSMTAIVNTITYFDNIINPPPETNTTNSTNSTVTPPPDNATNTTNSTNSTNTTTTTNFTATLAPVSDVESNGTGSAMATLSGTTLTGNGSVAGLGSSLATPGVFLVSGPDNTIEFALVTDSTDADGATFSLATELTEDQVTALMDGDYSVLVQTEDNPEGELIGQLAE